MWIGASGAFLAYWNGQETLLDVAYRSLEPERWAARVTLVPGWNRLLVKVCADESGSLLQVRLADASGAPDGGLEISTDPKALEEAAETAKDVAKKAGPGRRAATLKKQVVLGKDKGVTVVTGAEEGPRRLPPPWGGALAGLSAALDKKALDAETFEAYARYLRLTDSDDPATHVARDLAYRAAEGAPTVARLLLASELAEDRNARRAWVA